MYMTTFRYNYGITDGVTINMCAIGYYWHGVLFFDWLLSVVCQCGYYIITDKFVSLSTIPNDQYILLLIILQYMASA